jgi:hypothetical protein
VEGSFALVHFNDSVEQSTFIRGDFKTKPIREELDDQFIIGHSVGLDDGIKVGSNVVILLEGGRKVRLWEWEIIVIIIAIRPATSHCLCLSLSGNKGAEVK